MHITIINASPHEISQSNTVKMIEHFQKGVLATGASIEIYHLCKKSQYEHAKEVFIKNDNIVFALPVYAGIIPSFSMEFLQNLYIYTQQNDKNTLNKTISFVLQGGFPEACQRGCCEQYLKSIAMLLGGTFGGILSHCINAHFVERKDAKDTFKNYEEMGVKFIKNQGNFLFKEAIEFTGPEHFTEDQAKVFNRMFNVYYKYVSSLKGCDIDLSHKLYDYI